VETPGLGDFDLSGLQNPLPARAGWPPAAKWAVGCGSGCAGLVLLEMVAFWVFIAFYMHLRPPEGMAVRAQAPPRAVVGQKFPLTLVVENRGDRPFTVNSVTARKRLLSRLDLANPQADPRPTAGAGSPFGSGESHAFGSAIWQYSQSLKPGEKWTLRFDATPRQPGALKGALEVQANLAPKAARFSVEVQPASGEKQPPGKAPAAK